KNGTNSPETTTQRVVTVESFLSDGVPTCPAGGDFVVFLVGALGALGGHLAHPRRSGTIRGQSPSVGVGPPAPASSIGGGSRPSMARKVISFSPDSGSSSASTTIVSPARNSFHRRRSDSGSSTLRWMARRSGRAPK